MPKTKTLKEEIISALMTYGVVTKDDLKKSLKPYATREETRQMIMKTTGEAAEEVLNGVDRLLQSEYPKKKEVVLREDLKKLYA